MDNQLLLIIYCMKLDDDAAQVSIALAELIGDACIRVSSGLMSPAITFESMQS